MKSKRFINPLSDFGFKHIFGDEEVMKAFLNDIIRPNSPIVEITFIDKEMAEANDTHGVIYDLRCKTNDGSEFIVEMQRGYQSTFVHRILYYMSRNISMQGKMDGKKWNYVLKPVYGIFILDFHLKQLSQQKFRALKVKVDNTNEIFSDEHVTFTLELPSYRKMKAEECKNRIDYWLYNLANMEMMDKELRFEEEQPIFKRVNTIANIMNLTPEELEQYRISEKTSRDIVSVMQTERMEGHMEGLEKGLEKGRMEGLEEGRMETARAMKANGLSVDMIVRCTGLTEKQISDL